MMSEGLHLYNRQRYPNSLFEVMEVINAAAGPMSADQITDVLHAAQKPEAREKRVNLRERVRTALSDLLNAGRVKREEKPSKKGYIQHYYEKC